MFLTGPWIFATTNNGKDGKTYRWLIGVWCSVYERINYYVLNNHILQGSCKYLQASLVLALSHLNSIFLLDFKKSA